MKDTKMEVGIAADYGVEGDDINLLCLGGRIIGYMAARELINAFLHAEFSGAERHVRRLEKVYQLGINSLIFFEVWKEIELKKYMILVRASGWIL